MVNRRALYVCSERLEDHLRPQLGVEGLSCTNSRSAVVTTNGAVQDEGAPLAGTTWWCEVVAVEQVEHLCTKLNVYSLCDVSVLEDRQIHIGESRPVEAVAPQRAKGARGRIGEGCGIEPADVRFLAQESLAGIAHKNCPIVSFIRSTDVARGSDVEWLSAMEGDEAVENPAIRECAWTVANARERI